MKAKFWFIPIISSLILLNLTHRFYLNLFTHSLPHGIYIRIEGKPQRDDFAATCLTSEIAQYGIERGYLAQGICATGSVLVLKKIKGLPGDQFFIENRFLRLNGVLYPIMGKDSSGRALRVFYNQKKGVLDQDKYLLLSDFVRNSWDGRYWGPVSIQFLLKPFWIFEPGK